MYYVVLVQRKCTSKREAVAEVAEASEIHVSYEEEDTCVIREAVAVVAEGSHVSA